MEDRELVALCHQGQSQQFAILVERYQRLIFGLALHLLRSKEEAEDATQEAFLKVFHQIERQDDIDFLPYTKRVLSNLCLDKLRHRQVEQRHLSNDPDIEIPDFRTPEGALVQLAERQMLRHALQSLPPIYGEVLILHYSGELSYQEMADKMDQPMSIVKNRLFRAKKLLKDAYLELERGAVMHCQQVERVLDEYLSGQLEQQVSREVEAHLQTCAVCSSLFLAQDAELDALLTSDWYAVEPAFDLTAQVMHRVLAPKIRWGQLWWVILAWSGYVTTWLLVALGLFRPGLLSGLLGGLLSWSKHATKLLAPLVATSKALYRTLQLLQLSPVACLLLLLFAVLAIYGLRRLEKEGLA